MRHGTGPCASCPASQNGATNVSISTSANCRASSGAMWFPWGPVAHVVIPFPTTVTDFSMRPQVNTDDRVTAFVEALSCRVAVIEFFRFMLQHS